LEYENVPPNEIGTTSFPNYSTCSRWRDAVWVYTSTKASVVIVGRQASEDWCYGTSCYNPCGAAQGYNCYPYVPIMTWYDPADLAEVAQSIQNPEDPQPYAQVVPDEAWDKGNCAFGFGGVAYAPAGTYDTNGVLFVVEVMANNNTQPIIHMYEVEDTGSGDETAPVMSAAYPSGTVSCTSNPMNVTQGITTDEAATCKCGDAEDTYDNLSAIDNTGGTSHSDVVSRACGGGGGTSYDFYCQCQDIYENTTETAIHGSYTVSDAAPPPEPLNLRVISGAGVGGGSVGLGP